MLVLHCLLSTMQIIDWLIACETTLNVSDVPVVVEKLRELKLLLLWVSKLLSHDSTGGPWISVAFVDLASPPLWSWPVLDFFTPADSLQLSSWYPHHTAEGNKLSTLTLLAEPSCTSSVTGAGNQGQTRLSATEWLSKHKMLVGEKSCTIYTHSVNGHHHRKLDD